MLNIALMSETVKLLIIVALFFFYVVVLKPLGSRHKLSCFLTVEIGVASFLAFWLTVLYLSFGGDPMLGAMIMIVSFYYLPFFNLSREAVER